MAWKNVLYAVLAALGPVVYSIITGALPAFPLSSPDFVLLMLWVVDLLIGGWQLSKGVYISQYRLLGKNANPLGRGLDLNGLKPMLRALIVALIPLFYGTLVDAYQDFPLTLEMTVTVVVWIVGLAIGGWQVGKAYYVAKGVLYGKNEK
jgi:hypothetical protein